MKPATIKGRTIYLRELEAIHHIQVKDLRRREIIAIRNAIATARGSGAATGFLRVTSALLSWARDAGWIEHNPAIGIKRLVGGHLRAWTDAEADLAQSRLPEHLRRVVVLARYTGQRRGDLCAMTWAAYDGSTIRLRQQKAGDKAPELVVPVHRALKAELDAWKQSATSTMILTTAHGLPWQPMHISHMLPPAIQAIGLDAGLNVHGLRKLAATSLAQAGCSVHEIASVTGHKSLSMVQLYTASVDQRALAGAAISRLETSGNPKKKWKTDR